MRAAGVVDRTTHKLTTDRPTRRRVTLVSVFAMLATALAVFGAAPTQAAQAPGTDVPAWAVGNSWTYQTSFRYQADAADVTVNENVTYSVAGVQTYQGQEAYRLTISGQITGGSGSAAVEGVGNANLSNFSGSVSGTRYVRTSDLALLHEDQKQNLAAKASVSIISANITASIDLNLDPARGWRVFDFPLNAGDSWQLNETINYTGGFSYDAGSFGGGGDTFEGALPFQANANAANGSASLPIGNVSGIQVSSASADGQTTNQQLYSPNHKNEARQVLVLPLDGAKLTLTRNLSAASVGAPSPALSATATPSLTCAGGQVTVAGTLASAANGTNVTIALDQSQLTPGQRTVVTTQTGAGGAYSATLTAPSQSDGLNKNGSRANWGITVTSGSTRAATTLVVTPKNCTTLAYTGVSGAEQGSDALVSAQLTDLGGGSVNGKTVTFSLSGGGSVNATTNASGVATASLPVNGPVRSATVTASYAGATNQEAASATSPFEVGRIGTTTTVVADPAVVTVGDPTTFTATVNPGHGASINTGSVQFKVDGADFGAARPVSNGVATSAPYNGALGFHDVVAVFTGTDDHATSTSGAFSFRVRNPLLATTTTSSVTPGSIVYGQSVTLSADVASAGGDATGTVTFSSAAGTLATTGIDASGHAEVVVDDIPVGSHQVVATYSGDDVYAGSAASPKNLGVAKAEVDVELTSSDDSTVTGEAVNFTATVGVQAPGGGSPDGTVQLRIDGVDVGDPVALSGGTAVFPPVTSMGAGNHTVAAIYSGSANYDNGQDSLTQVVAKADTTTIALATPSPAVQDTAATLTARVTAVAPGSGAPSGTVTFSANGDELGAAPLAAVSGGAEASIDISDLAPGVYTITATFGGDGDYNGSTSETISHTVIAAAAIVPTETVVTSSQNPSTYGELVTFTATVTAEDGSTPEGAVQFSLDGTDFGDPIPVDANGVAESDTLASPEPGDHTLIATFKPATGWSGSGDILTQTVEAAGVEVSLSSTDASADYGQSVSFSATVSTSAIGVGTPAGHVQFVLDGTPLGEAVELDGDGNATSPSVTNLSPGDHEVRALYSGSTYFKSGSSSLTQGVAKVGTTTTLSATPANATFGQTVTLKATVTPASSAAGNPTGTVVFKRGSTTIASVPVASGPGGTAVATVNVSTLAAGSHAITAEYSGTSVFAASASSATTVTVGKVATILRAEAALVKLIPLGLPLGMLQTTLVDTTGNPVVGVPIEFRIGPNLICTSTTDAQGVAQCNARPQLLALTLALGYKASFAGDANHLPSNANGTIIK